MFLSFCINDANNAKEPLSAGSQPSSKELLRTSPTYKSKENQVFVFIGMRQLLQNHPKVMSLIFLGEIITPAPAAKVLGLIMDIHLTYD